MSFDQQYSEPFHFFTQLNKRHCEGNDARTRLFYTTHPRYPPTCTVRYAGATTLEDLDIDELEVVLRIVCTTKKDIVRQLTPAARNQGGGYIRIDDGPNGRR